MASSPRPSVAAAAVVLVTLASCGGSGPQPQRDEPRAPRRTAEATVEVTFTYGSEKKKWIAEATEAFNRARHATSTNRRIVVNAFPMGSGECVDEVLAGTRHADLISPASAAFIRLGNARSQAATGTDLVGPTENLVVSPVVIATWKPMAEALGWPSKPVGWSEVLALARSRDGWASRGHPEWGRFAFGHTHPEYSNSGLIAVFAETYAGAGKVSGLTLEDLARPEVASFVRDIEHAVVHYGSSTGFFGETMFANGPGYLSAAVLYENMVVEAASPRGATEGAPAKGGDLAFPVVAIYPREGTFWSDHPAGIVQRPWVDAEHREAAEAYLRFLLDRPQQERALAFGFRPGDPSVPLGPPLDGAHGVDPTQPTTTLEMPDVPVMNAALELWKSQKKHANVVLALDVSGSMKDGDKIGAAKAGAAELLNLLQPEDRISLLVFNDDVRWAAKDVSVATGRAQVVQQVDGLFADGGTALNDAILAAHDHLAKSPDAALISAVVVLSDGEDRDSEATLDDVLARLGSGEASSGVRVFTIAYGKDAKADVLKRVSERSQAKPYKGTTEDIRAVFRDISTFF